MKWKENSPYYYWQTNELAQLFAEHAREGYHIAGYSDHMLTYDVGEKNKEVYQVVVFNPKFHGKSHLDQKFLKAGWKHAAKQFSLSPRIIIYRHDVSEGNEVKDIELPENYNVRAMCMNWMDKLKEMAIMIISFFVVLAFYLASPNHLSHFLDDTIPALLLVFLLGLFISATQLIGDYRVYKKWQANQKLKPRCARFKMSNMIFLLLGILIVTVIGIHTVSGYSEYNQDINIGETNLISAEALGFTATECELTYRESFAVSDAYLYRASSERGDMEENYLHTRMKIFALLLASEFSEKFLEENYTETPVGEQIYLYEKEGSTTIGGVYLHGNSVITIKIEDTDISGDQLLDVMKNLNVAASLSSS